MLSSFSFSVIVDVFGAAFSSRYYEFIAELDCRKAKLLLLLLLLL